MDAEIVHQFKKDDRVPDWLINIDPVNPSSHLDFFRFGMDGFVVEVENGYILIPKNLKDITNGPYRFMYVQGDNLHISTETKPVAMPISWQIIGILDQTCQS